MENTKLSRIEPLEQRIAPAALAINRFVDATEGSRLELQAGDMLSTGGAGGSYLLFVEKGNAIVFTTDLNNNDQIDFNEITGISAGNGLRLISFVDIHGDIVTNLNSDGKTLTDSDNDASNGVDGRVLRDSLIEKIELRSLTEGDLSVDQAANLNDRLAFSTYSIFGSIFAGGGFGVGTDGLLIDTIGETLQQTKFSGASGITKFVDSVPIIGSIKVGTGASGEMFSFGTSAAGQGAGFNGEDIQGELLAFKPGSGKNGADISNVRSFDATMPFNIGVLKAGDGGFNGRGGNISNILITGDVAGGYSLIAGNGGDGGVGQAGGSIINYQDLGSITSQVILQSGTGGRGLTGVGGNGGSVDLVGTVPISLAGRIFITLGDGGDGLTGGGVGGSQKTGSIGTPETQVPFGLSVASTQHNPGDIFNTISDVPAGEAGYHAIRGFDFDLDGFNDMVYTTAQPNQLVVLFGSAGGFDEQGTRYPGASGTLYLDSPINAEALIVADLNGDGFSDIATASNDPSMAGVSVYLSKYTFDPATLEPTFVGFRDPTFNALPGITGAAGVDLYLQRPVRITDVVAGDFNNDGVVDLAVNTIQETIDTPREENNVLIVLTGDSVGGSATGRFFADTVTVGALAPFLILSDNTDEVVLRASALRDGQADQIFAGVAGQKEISQVSFVTNRVVFTSLALGKVDTNRDVSDPTKRDKISLEDATLRDFTIVDVENDGDADLFVLTDNPEGFLVAFQGNQNAAGATTLTLASNNPVDDSQDRAGENAGIRLSEDPPKGLGLSSTLVAILTTAADADGIANDITLVDYNGDTGLFNGFKEVSFSGVVPATATAPGVIFTAAVASTDGTLIRNRDLDQSVLAFDTYRPRSGVTPVELSTVGYGVIIPVLDNDDLDFLTLSRGTFVAGPIVPLPPGTPAPIIPFVEISLANNGLFMRSGDGGDAANGKGGAGGQIGDKLVAANGLISGTFNVTLPAADGYEPLVRLVAGNGGDGYSGGGVGGSVRGVTVNQVNDASFNVRTFLFAGDGGDSIKGAGGAGGNLDALSVLGGSTFVAGDGGRGVSGGNGGSVLGNKIAGLPDTSNSQSLRLAVQGGEGGLGLKRGGDGGSILSFTPEFRAVLGGESGGVLYYSGGAGGNSLSGAGGRGGSVVNSSALAVENNLVADIILLGGNGGNGASGGGGGDITKFVNVQGTGSNPLSLSVIAGSGGSGSTGRGGSGGKISQVDVTARGVGSVWTFDFEDPDKIELFPGTRSILPVNFGRYIGGEGGVSFGNVGGSGGNVEASKGSIVSTSMVVAAGKGGDGILGGGAGGSSLNLDLNASATLGKVLVIAGDGGDVYGAQVTPADPLAPGDRNGSGGNGGNIIGLKQDASGNAITDLIAGNGGSTINYGSTLDSSTKVGRGGSISKVKLAGDIGVIAPDVAIRSYTDIFLDEQISDFVAATLISTPSAQIETLGNVGLVAGASGRVRDNNNDGTLDPAPISSVNGSVIDVEARNIMSAIAGSVDRIASIQVLTNVRTTVNGAVYGADKNIDSDGNSASPADAVPYSTRTDYLTSDGRHTRSLSTGGGEAAPVIGGKLVDGAIVAKNDRVLKSIRDFVRR